MMSVLAAIGRTPLVELTKLGNGRPAVRILGKLEGNNPGGSVKDRPALWMIQAAEESGELALNDKVYVGDDESFDMTRRLAVQEGIFVGMSSGAAVVGALRFASRLRSGTIVVILPDRGDRYLSTTLFRPICAACPP
jgi:cysteine synthase B